MSTKNNDIKSRVYGKISASTPGRIWTVGDFKKFGSRDAISKVLQRLETAGDLRRVGHGLYDRPRKNPLTNKPTPPDYRAAIEAMARRDNARILVDGMTAANDLGLSDAVPGRVIVHTDARLKPLRLGNLSITFRPTSARKLYWAGRPAMRIVQALHWLKPKLDLPAERQRILDRMKVILRDPKKGAALRKDLRQGLATLPVWMQDFVNDLLSEQTSAAKAAGRTNLPKRATL
jgi:hypothetical protein